MILLGIHDHRTPGLASEISIMVSALSSFEEAKQIIKDRGLNLDVKTIRQIARTIADMDGSENLELSHVTEAVQYRRNG